MSVNPRLLSHSMVTFQLNIGSIRHHVKAPVIFFTGPPPTGIGGDNNIPKIKALLEPLLCQYN